MDGDNNSYERNFREALHISVQARVCRIGEAMNDIIIKDLWRKEGARKLLGDLPRRIGELHHGTVRCGKDHTYIDNSGFRQARQRKHKRQRSTYVGGLSGGQAMRGF